MKDISFRPIDDQDHPYLFGLYSSTRANEMAMVADWTLEQKHTFLQQQFSAQHSFYQDNFPSADYEIILFQRNPIGRLYTDRRKNEIRLIDITLHPDQRGNGLGTQLLKKLMAEAKSLDIPLSIHVEHYNPAIRLYQRLGFKKIEDQGVYDLMEWNPLEHTLKTVTV